MRVTTLFKRLLGLDGVRVVAVGLEGGPGGGRGVGGKEILRGGGGVGGGGGGGGGAGGGAGEGAGGGGSRPPAAALASVSALRLSHARLLRPLAAHAPSPGRAADGLLPSAPTSPPPLPPLR